MNWTTLTSRFFRCGHQKVEGNIERFTVDGRQYERCWECHQQAKARWHGQRRELMAMEEEA